MSERTTSSIPAECVAAYDRVIQAVSGLERKGAGLPYTSVNGNMFSFLADSGVLALRLSAADRKAFMERFEASLHEAHGRVLKEYVRVPASMLADTMALTPWFVSSWTNACALKPKGTARKASARK